VLTALTLVAFKEFLVKSRPHANYKFIKECKACENVKKSYFF